MDESRKKWVVTSDGAYLCNLQKALDGMGLAGGAYTKDVRKAQRFTLKEADRHARRVGGKVKAWTNVVLWKNVVFWKNHLLVSEKARASGMVVDWRANYKGERARCFNPGPGKMIRAEAGGKVSIHRSLDVARDTAMDRMLAAVERKEAERAANRGPQGSTGARTYRRGGAPRDYRQGRSVKEGQDDMGKRAKTGTGETITITWRDHLHPLVKAHSKMSVVDWRTTYEGQVARCYSPSVDGVRGKGVWAVAGGVTSYHRSLPRAQHAATGRLLAAARRARLEATVPPGTFYLFAVRGSTGPVGKAWFRSISRSRARRKSPWAPTMDQGKLHYDLGQARGQRTKLMRSHPDMAPIEVVMLKVTMDRVVPIG